MRIAAVVCLLAIGAPCVAAAQPQPSVEVFGGYSYLWDPDNSVLAVTVRDNRFAVGWTAGAARPLWKWVAVAGEAAGHYKRRTTLDANVSLSLHTVAAGLRGSARIGPFVQFAQLLAGTAHGRADAFGSRVAVNQLLLQPGGGLDYPVARRLAARLQLDYRWIRGTGERANVSQLRAVAAVVFR